MITKMIYSKKPLEEIWKSNKNKIKFHDQIKTFKENKNN